MSALLIPRGKLGAPVEKVVGEKVQPTIRQPQRRRPPHVSSAEAVGPYLEHAPTDLRGENPPPDEVSPDAGTHDVNQEMLPKAYRRGFGIGVGRKIVRKSLGFLFGQG